MFDEMFTKLFQLSIYFVGFIGIMISLCLIVTFIKILTEISKLKEEKRAYELIQEEEEVEIKRKKEKIVRERKIAEGRFNQQNTVKRNIDRTQSAIIRKGV